jgi:tetratricopeptide (TPR) repeat protein
VGPRADIYAFGLTLYELATGRNPYAEDDYASILRRKLHEELEPPGQAEADLGPFWRQVIGTCVRRDPSGRFASAGELRRILREGEESEWWRRVSAGSAAPSAERALKLLALERRAPLIGREASLGVLREAHRRASSEGGVLMLGGPSGVGKSRLLYDFLEGVTGAGGPTLAAGRGVGAGGRGFGPFADALRDVLTAESGSPDGGRGALTARLEELLSDMPGVVEPLAEFLFGNLQPGPDSRLSQDALFAALGRVVRALAEHRPLVIVIEDLHLGGIGTLDLFAYLTRSVAGHPAFLVGVYASDEIEESSALPDLVAGAEDGDHETSLELTGLSAAQTEELVRCVVGLEKTVRAVAPALRTHSEGNPLIVLESLAHLEATGILVETDGGLECTAPIDEMTVPSSVRDLVALKLGRLDEEQRETLEVAAVLGVDFEATLLAQVLDETPIELLQRLAGLERKHRLLVSSGKDAFRFASHPLYEAVYGSITPDLRIEYHAVVADTLLETETPTGAQAYAMLHHLFFAERALEAAPFLESALDYMSANFHASFANPLLDKIAEAFAAAPPDKRFAIAMKQWAFRELGAPPEEQVRVLELAREMADRMGDPALRARVHGYRAGSYWYAGDYDRAQEEARLGLELSLEAGDRQWEATCLHTLGVVAFRRGALQDAAARWREALAIRREIEDRRGEASTLQALSLVMPAIGEDDRVLGTMQEALTIWREIGERRGEAAMLMNIGNQYVERARYEEGLHHLEQAIDMHRETGALVNEAIALANLGYAKNILGYVDEARASWERALQIFVDHHNPNGELAARIWLGGALGACGELEEGREHLQAAIDLATRTGNKSKLAMAHRELGEMLHRAGVRDAGLEHLDEALALDRALDDRSGLALTLGLLGRAALADGAPDDAVRHLAEALPDARNNPLLAPLVLSRLALAHFQAGREEEAVGFAREARERVEGEGGVSTQDGPEIYHALHRVYPEDGFLDRARALLEERARRIRNDAHRAYFLDHRWPNPEIRAPAADPAAGASGD